MKPAEKMTILKNLSTVSCEIQEILKELKRLGTIVNNLTEWVNDQEVQSVMDHSEALRNKDVFHA